VSVPLELYLAYLIACIVIVVVPGPTVTLVIANSLTHGMRAGLLNVAGTQIGIALMIGLVGLGLASLIESMGWWFAWVRLAGAAYLIWLGFKLLWFAGALSGATTPALPRGGFFLQGLLVALSNPKTLVFFGAFIPQFIDPTGDYIRQLAILGITAVAVASVSDSLYAVLASSVGQRLTGRGMKWIARASGGFLVGGGLWLALARSR
jgi:threonine/homoserine/homoserine lactone efflux protein